MWVTAAPATRTSSPSPGVQQEGCGVVCAGASEPSGTKSANDRDGRGISLNNPGVFLMLLLMQDSHSRIIQRCHNEIQEGILCDFLHKTEMQISYVNIFILYKWKTQTHGNTVT